MTEDEQKVQAALDLLGEHFDAVHIFVSRHEAALVDGTACVSMGCGNYFARYGHVRNWLVEQDARTKQEATRED